MLGGLYLFAEGLAIDDPFLRWKALFFGSVAVVFALVRKFPDEPREPIPNQRARIRAMLLYIPAVFLIPVVVMVSLAVYHRDKPYQRCSGLEKPEQTIAACREILGTKKLTPAGLSKVYYNIGVAYYHKGQLDQAIMNYSRAITSNPDYADAFLNRCGALVAKRDFSAALKDCEEAIRLAPYDPMTILGRGAVYLGNRQYGDALRDVDLILTLEPKNTLALTMRCDAHNLLGQTDLALADCNHALALSPHDVIPLGTRGLVYLKTGDYAAALADFDTVIKLDGKQATSLYGRGLIKRIDGDLAGAEADIAEAVKINPNVAEDIAPYGL
jgi:tetratricopeptide (TPR) repeat protein